VRANLAATRTLQQRGRYDEVQKIFDRMAGFPDPAARHVSAINSIVLQCGTKGMVSLDALAKLETIAGDRLQIAELLMLENLVRYAQEHDCQNLDRARLASTIVKIVDKAPQSPKLVQLWRSRFYAAKLYASSGHLPQAQQQLELAWGTGTADPAVGAFLVQVQLAHGDTAGARRTLPGVRSRVPSWDQRGQARMVELSKALEARD